MASVGKKSKLKHLPCKEEGRRKQSGMVMPLRVDALSDHEFQHSIVGMHVLGNATL